MIARAMPTGPNEALNRARAGAKPPCYCLRAASHALAALPFQAREMPIKMVHSACCRSARRGRKLDSGLTQQSGDDVKRTHAVMGFAFGTVLLLASGAPASAGQSTPGIPGTVACNGQTAAYVAQGNPIPGASANGLGNVAAANGISVQVVQSLIAAFCGGSTPG
jgi:hypothetical protein